MDEHHETEQSEPRSEVEIFEDLRALAQSDGALHEISSLIYRDLLVTVDRREGRVIDDPEYRWSTSKLNKNEMLLLLGLMVQSPTKHTYSVQSGREGFASSVDALFREFHDRVLTDVASSFQRETGRFVEPEDSIGRLGREAIYYGADGFYLHQLLNFSRQRYRKDALWLQQNVGISIRPMLNIAKFIVEQVNGRMTAVGQLREQGRHFAKGDLTNSLLIAKEDVRRKFGAKSDPFFTKFVTPITATNGGFTNPFAINAVALAPIVEMGDYLYVPIQYRLCESIYESPFYWMMADDEYEATHADHRGVFLEETVAQILSSVFGPQNVYENVVVARNARDRGGEIDVLVVYGEFVIVVQAKSKRITLKARAGETDALKTDFKGAIQDPYRQALECIELIEAGAKCIAKDGKELEFRTVSRFFPMVVLSDHFPASTMLSRTLLKRGDKIAPVIWDIGMLDCIARLLPTPMEMLLYLKCRSDTFDNIVSDSEYNYLGYHIRSKLALPPDSDILMLERDFATVVDDFMIAADLGIKAERPVGILERLEIPVVSKLLRELKNADPTVASIVVDLYDFSSAALRDVSTTILNVRDEVAATGKAIKAFSIRTAAGGLTYAVTLNWDGKAAMAAHAIGAKRKYDTKSDRWYVILDSIETDNPVDGFLPLVWPWMEDENEAQASRQVAKMFNSSWQERTVGEVAKGGREKS